MRAFRALVVITLLPALLAVAPSAGAGTPTVRIRSQQRGASATLQLGGLTPNAVYRLSSDYETFPNGASVRASATGTVVTTAVLKASVPLGVESVHITVGTTTVTVPIAAPTVELAPCPAEQHALGKLVGFPPGRYALSSPVITLNSDGVTVGRTGAGIDVAVPADAPGRFPVTVTPAGTGTAGVTTEVALRRAAVGFAAPDTPGTTGYGSCFHPGATVRFSAPPGGIIVPSPVVADAQGGITFPVRVAAGAVQRRVSLAAADGRGSVGSGSAVVGATTEVAGTYVPHVVSPHLAYALGTFDCLPAVYHLVRTGGTIRYDVAWLGTGTHRPTAQCALLVQASGNMVVFSGASILWQNGARGGTRLTLEDTGELVERATGGTVVWSSRTGLHPLPVRGLGSGQVLHAGQSLRGGPATLTLKTDGNLVLYRAGVPVWTSHTAGSHANRLVMQHNGAADLLIPSGARIWSTYTVGRGNHLGVLGRGEFAVFAPGGHVLWRS